MRRTIVVALVLSFVGGWWHAPETAAQQTSLHTLRWMTGCWERVRGDLVIEEHWLRPRGGLMPGVNRTLRSERAVAHEFLRIVEDDGGIVLVAAPSGQATTEFAALTVTDTLALFENPEHDFPQRIGYSPAKDSLRAWIEGEADGERRRVDFGMARVACEPAARAGPPTEADGPPCKVAALDSLAFMVGRWTVRSRTRDASGAWVETDARAVIRQRLDGCLIEKTWDGSVNGEEHRMVTWLSHDRDEGRWEQVVVDDAHGELLAAQGRWHDGRLRLFVSQFRDGRLLLDRTTITPVDDGRFEWELESSYDGGETWRSVWRMGFEKIGPSPGR